MIDSIKKVKKGDIIKTRIKDGYLESEVTNCYEENNN